ncbi:hypothetical protein GCM10027612_26820 [Microbispora bryophytorum subsp. camponoti]
MAQPLAALALLTEGAGRPEWARLVAADPDAGCRERLAACPGLPTDVAETLAADTDIRVVAELALWTTSDMATRLAEHPHAEVRRAVAANEATPPSVLAALLTGEGLPRLGGAWSATGRNRRSSTIRTARSPTASCRRVPRVTAPTIPRSTTRSNRR